MNHELLQKLKNHLISVDGETFRGARLQHSIKLCNYLYACANGFTNTVELSGKKLVNDFFKNAKYKYDSLKKLLEYGVIETLPGYVVGSKSKRYRLTNEYLPEEKQSKYKIEQLMMGKDFLSKNGVDVSEDDFFNAKPGPCGITEMFGDEKKPEQSNTQIIRYKGIKDVEIERVTIEDTNDFKKYMSIINKLSIEASEELFIRLNLWSREKTWYMYDKWIKKYGYPENNVED